MSSTAKIIAMPERNDGPQLEDGYVRIANELFDAILAFGLSGRQQSVLLAVVRKTYGYGKKTDDVSAAQLGELCGVARNHVTETLGQLAAMNVITLRRGEYGMVVGVNKHYQQWKKESSPKSGLGSPNKGLVPNQDVDSPKSGLEIVLNREKSSPKSGHTKDNQQKTTSKDNLKRQSAQDAPEVSEAFAEAWECYPKREGGNSKAAALKAWMARVNGGVSESDMLAGVKRYAAFCDAKGKTGTEYVKQAATFFGPSGAWMEAWAVQPIQSGPEINQKTGARKIGGVWAI